MTDKGIYPYEYITSFEVLEEPSLPPIEKFYSNQCLKGITDKEYSRAQEIWTRYRCLDLWIIP